MKEILLILLIGAPFISAFGFNEVIDIITVAKDVIVGIAKTWSIIDDHVDFDDIPVPLFEKTQKKLFGRINIINQKLDKIGLHVESAGISVSVCLTTITKTFYSIYFRYQHNNTNSKHPTRSNTARITIKRSSRLSNTHQRPLRVQISPIFRE